MKSTKKKKRKKIFARSKSLEFASAATRESVNSPFCRAGARSEVFAHSRRSRVKSFPVVGPRQQQQHQPGCIYYGRLDSSSRTTAALLSIHFRSQEHGQASVRKNSVSLGTGATKYFKKKKIICLPHLAATSIAGAPACMEEPLPLLCFFSKVV